MLTADDLRILGFTVAIAALTTTIILPIGTAVAFVLARSRGGLWRGIVETVLSLPLVLPPTAVGMLLLDLLHAQGFCGRLLDDLGIEVLFTWKAVVLASAVMSFPLLVRPARTAFEEIDPRFIGIARTLGRGPWYVFARVTLPLAWRGILVGTLMAFSRALGEFGATILIAGNIPGRTQTLALAIFQRAQIGQDDRALRLVGVTVCLAFTAVGATEIVLRRRGRKLNA